MDLKHLLIRVLQGKATEQQRIQLQQWLDSIESKRSGSIQSNNKVPFTRDDLAEIRNAVLANARMRKSRHRWIAASIVILLIIIGAIAIPLSTKSSVFVFHEATLDQVISEIETSFNVTISVESTIRECRFTGEFHNPKTANEILSALSAATGLEYKLIKPGHFEVTGIPCNTSF